MAAAPAAKVVVAAVDGSAGSEEVLAWVAGNVAQGARVKVLVCLPAQDGAYMSRAAAQEAHEALRRRFPQAQDVEVVSARDGTCEAVSTAILERAQAMQASVLAIAPHERSATERVLKGSVTDFLARRARIPLLVVRSVGRGGEA